MRKIYLGIVLFLFSTLTQAIELHLPDSKWKTNLYGFVESDFIYDTTLSFNDVAGSALIPILPPLAPHLHRMTFSIRNSRLGISVNAPEFMHINTQGVLEMDFLGNQPPNINESLLFPSPTFRVRHAFVKLTTDYIDVLMGQFWQVLGWQGAYFPPTIQIQGVAGELYARTPQIRVSKTFKLTDWDFDLMLAMLRPPQRDAGAPEGAAGLRFAYKGWRASEPIGAISISEMPLSFAITGDLRRFKLPAQSDTPSDISTLQGWGVAASTFVPLYASNGNLNSASLSFIGTYLYGYGIEDLFTNLTEGIPAFTSSNGPNIDSGLVGYSTSTNRPETIQLQTFYTGLLFFPPALQSRLWLAVNFTRTTSANAKNCSALDRVLAGNNWLSADIVGYLTPELHLGFDYVWLSDQYANQQTTNNHRFQFSATYTF